MRNKTSKPEVLILLGNTKLTPTKWEEFEKWASEIGCALSSYKNFSDVGQGVDPIQVVSVVTLNHKPKSIPEVFLRRPILKVVVDKKYSINEVKFNNRNGDGKEEYIYRTGKIIPEFMFKLLGQIKLNHAQKIRRMKEKNGCRILFLIGRTELSLKERERLRMLASEIVCNITIDKNISSLDAKIDPKKVVLIVNLNYVPERIPKEYLVGPTPMLYVFNQGKGAVERTKNVKFDGFNNFRMIAEKFVPELVFKKILEIRCQKQNHDFN